MVLPGMEIWEEDGLDDYYNISNNWIDQDSIAGYTTVDAIDTGKARALGVSENQTSSPREDNSSPRARTLRNLPLVDDRIQLNPPNVFR
ncbi:hypothetical protein R1sor_022634 [Riccia sorocarpa]|uniref:Uncharacterized protein n=1 Tax=Riccia sorocarpa TaxID=122646 RepID=A0ABD3GKE4_9MARC